MESRGQPSFSPALTDSLGPLDALALTKGRVEPATEPPAVRWQSPPGWMTSDRQEYTAVVVVGRALACSEKSSATWSPAWARAGFRRGAVNFEEVKPMSARRKSRRTFAIELELDEAGWWVASAKGVEGVHTQGRSIQQVLRRIRNALEAAGEPGKTAQLVPEFHLNEELIAQVRKAKEAR